MVLLDHRDEGLEQPHGNVVGAVIVVAIAGEVALGLELEGEAGLIADDVDLGIFDGGDGVDHMREAGDTGGKRAAHIGVDEGHLLSLIEILVVHVVDGVERLHVGGGKPFHHIHEAGHELVVGEHIAFDGPVSGTHLLTRLTVDATADGVGEALGEVGAGTEELHLLARLCGADATADAVVVAPDRAHHVVVLILYAARLDRDEGGIALETLGQTAAVEHGEVGFGRRTHILQRMEETEVVARYHVAAVLTNAGHLERSPYGVAGEQLVVRRNAGELHHAELHHQVVDELLGILLGERALGHIAAEIDVEEGADAAHRHCGAVLGLHCAEVAEVEPLHGLAGVAGRLRDVEAIDGSHLLEALQGFDLHRHLLAQAHHLVNHLAVAHVAEVFALLLNKPVNAIERHTAVVAHDATAAVGVGQAGEDMVMTHAAHLGGIDIEHAVVVGLDVFRENLMQLL